MNHFLHTIRFRIMLAFGIAVALMLSLGLFSLYGMSKLSDNMQTSYSGNTLPISQLAGVRANVLNTRRVLWMIQATQETHETSKVRDAVTAIERPGRVITRTVCRAVGSGLLRRTSKRN